MLRDDAYAGTDFSGCLTFPEYGSDTNRRLRSYYFHLAKEWSVLRKDTPMSVMGIEYGTHATLAVKTKT